MRKALTGFAIVAFVAGVALLTVSLAQSSTALAQETEKEFFFQPLAEVLDELVEDEVITEDQRNKIADAFEQKAARFGKGVRGIPHLEIVAEVLDIEVDDLADMLRDGATIAEIAGSRTQEVVDALIAEHSARIDEAVADERIAEERAEELRNSLAEKVEAIVNGDHALRGAPWHHFHGPRGFDPGPHGLPGSGGGFGLDRIAEALGFETEELMEELAGGSSLLDIAERQGLTVPEVVEAVLADVDERLADLVADERITRERADALRERLAEGIESLLSAEFPPSGGLEGHPGLRDFGRRFPFPGAHFDRPSNGFFPFPGHHDRWSPGEGEVGGAGTSA